ncbi:MAG: hypothetical protein KatS3mg015_2426 [Fimbriimonadales bacterium]|nr:MAG: hypothetical protein KatS3mg015_2426 [Fimbriimonadales bacterium]
MRLEVNMEADLLNKLLNELERGELPLLGWGVVDGHFTEDELEEKIEEFADHHGLEAGELRQELLKRGLVFEFPTQRGTIFRTRMAETVRLLARLRQLFPEHLREPRPKWRSAPTLVSDYRFVARPRQFPRRHLALPDIKAHLEESGVKLLDIQSKALEALITDWRLADFQVAATKQILLDLQTQKRSRGVIVGAGTGTGKTLAFYLPALLQVTKSVQRKNTRFVRVLALYPRKELLKDQLSSALGQVRTLNRALRRRIRPISLGALYGDTPYRAQVAYVESKWPSRGDAYVCPYFRDPEDGGELLWRKSDIEKGRECLYNARTQKEVCGPETVRLTRESLVKAPPDLLFSTTEMLNRNMGNATIGPLFGVRGRPPEMVLLDEAHTYSGVHGAQVAYLLQRWRQAMPERSRPHFTGLSATLADAVPFFASLTGLPEHTITSIRADHPQWPVEETGHEYLVALRGDPFSGASLLATTIQATMLMRRALDPMNHNVSGGLYGQRLFIFTDDLDVTNRLFDDVADAEGLRRRNGRLVRNPHKEPLAALRSPLNEIEEEERFEDGQSWRFVERLGYDPKLTERLRLDRVSSQDAGVASNADIVVATASLEVGYDDDRCGAVLQHKAPRNTASFLQRKGRAGRPQRMRPWTCVVLSDYGRDRIAYQNYDALFDPEIKPEYLPLGNRYVLKMQATYTLLEWLALKVLDESRRRHRYLDAWRAMSTPAHNDYLRRDQQALASVARQLLEEAARSHGPLLYEFADYLKEALGVSEDEATALLWGPPRALLVSALPTLLRRLESDWARFKGGKEPPSSQPLPEFVPPNLFTELNLPEVTLTFPPLRIGKKKKEQEPEQMEIERALRDFAPGRVNRRFGYADQHVRHWIPLPSWDTPSVAIPVASFLPQYDPLGAFQYWTATGGIGEMEVLRPIQINLHDVPKEIQDASNARPRWHTQILPPELRDLGEGQRHPVSDLLPWHRLVKEVRFYTHLALTPVEVRRFTPGSDARVLYRRFSQKPSTEHFVSTAFAKDGHEVALGFTQTVDAIAFQITIPDVEDLYRALGNDIRGSLHTAYFKHSILQAGALMPETSIFDRDWLQQVLLAALVRTAWEEKTSLQEAFERLRASDALFGKALLAALDQIQKARFEPETEEVERGRVGERLAKHLENPDLLDVLACFPPLLWQEPDHAFFAWLRQRVRTTLGAALLTACAELTPSREEDGLLLDLDAGPPDPSRGSLDSTPEEDILWITEAKPGGNGLVEAIQQRYAHDPRHFFDLVAHALHGSDFELVCHEMPRAVHLFQTDEAAAQASEQVRSARGVKETRTAHQQLREVLREGGILCTHAVYAALSHRLLRPGASRETVDLVAELLARWDALEAQLGVEIEPRLIAYIVAQDESLLQSYPARSSVHLNDPSWRAGTLYSLLWTRGGALRSLSLQPYNPFATFLPTDRLLVLHLLPEYGDTVLLDDPAWRERVEESLRKFGRAFLEAPAERSDDLGRALLSFAEQPIESDFLLLFAHVVAVRRDPKGYRVTLILPEAIQ